MFGVSSFCLHQEPLDRALDRLSTITDCVEVMDEGLHFLESADPLENYDFSYYLHAPSRGVNIASLLEPIRKASVEVIVQSFSIAAEVGAGVVVHPGYYAWREERERAEAGLAQSLRELAEAAREHSIRYCIENMGNWEYFFLRFPDEISLLDGTDLALDVGHANLNGCLPGFLDASFTHTHIHDNDGLQDLHTAVGTGTIDFSAVMRAVRKNGAMPIVEVETLEGTIQSIEALKSL
jgi:sugar phosphate isomerase/epimerase